MASQEVLVAQLSAQSFDERGEIIGKVVDNRLHPQVNGGTDAKVQPKSRIISMLHLIQRQCTRGVQLGLQYRWLNLQAFLNPPYLEAELMFGG
jgi:hypothetical protein